MNQQIQSISNQVPMSVQTSVNQNSGIKFSSKIQRACRALLIDLPLSTLSRVRSINERLSYEEEKGYQARRDYWHLFITPRGEEIVVEILSQKSADGKQQVMFIQNGEQDKNVWKNLKKKAKDVRDYYLPEVEHQNIHWSIFDIDFAIHNINDKVCL